MISAEAIANLVIWVVVMVAFSITQRRGLTSFHSRHRGVRYRRLSTSDALKLIRKRGGWVGAERADRDRGGRHDNSSQP